MRIRKVLCALLLDMNVSQTLALRLVTIVLLAVNSLFIFAQTISSEVSRLESPSPLG